MDRHERAETAVRLVGLVALVHGGVTLVFAVVRIALASQGSSPGGMWVIAECAGPVLEVLLGMGLLAGAGAVGELLVPRGGECEGSSLAEMVALGTFALGVYFLAGVLSYLIAVAAMTAQIVVVSGGSWRSALPGRQLGPPYRMQAVQVVTGGLVAATLLAGGQLLARWGPARRRLGRRLSPAAALATGFAPVAVFIAGRTAVVYMYQMARLGRLGAPLAGGAAVSAPLVWQDVDTALRLLEVLVILLLCARAGRWLARGAPKGPRPVLPALGREGWMTAALAGLLLWGMFTLMARLRVLAARGLTGPLGPTLQWVVVVAAPVLSIAAMVAGSRWGPGAADADARGAACQEGDRGAALVAVEVAVTVAALFQLLQPGWVVARALYSSLPMLLTVALALLLRGDVARWCVRGAADGADDLRERRRAALYTVLCFLGIVMTLEWARMALMAALTSAGVLTRSSLPIRDPLARMLAGAMPYVQLAGAVMLLLARGPLSRLLSYGPLLHTRAAARGG